MKKGIELVCKFFSFSLEYRVPSVKFACEIIDAAAAAAKSLQSCPTLCDPTDGSPPGSPSPGFSRQEHWSGLPFPSLNKDPDSQK